MADNQFHRDASGRLTFEMFDLPADSYTPVCAQIKAKFGLARLGDRVAWFDLACQDYQLGEQVIGLEWDNWSGFIVVAKTPESEPLVQTVGAWLLASSWATCGAGQTTPARPVRRPGWLARLLGEKGRHTGDA